MKFTATVIAIALLSVSLLGFAAMSHGPMGCDSLVSGMTATDCPQASISMVLHHISAYTSFSEATVSFAMATFLSVLLLAVIAIYIFSQGFRSDRPHVFSALYLRACEDSSLAARHKTYHWLSLLENSPSTL